MGPDEYVFILRVRFHLTGIREHGSNTVRCVLREDWCGQGNISLKSNVEGGLMAVLKAVRRLVTVGCIRDEGLS